MKDKKTLILSLLFLSSLDQHLKLRLFFPGHFEYTLHVAFFPSLLSNVSVQTTVFSFDVVIIDSLRVPSFLELLLLELLEVPRSMSWSDWQLSMDLTTLNNFLKQEPYFFLPWKRSIPEAVLIFKAAALEKLTLDA